MIHLPPKNFSDLSWRSRFVENFPGDPESGNFVRQVENVAYSEVRPTPVQEPALLGWSQALAGELGIRRPGATDSLSLELLAGNRTLPTMRPYSARYGGHQFGQWAGQLGDGRAITLGEADFGENGYFEFQLKGAGPTPYSRRADGRAVLRSSMREFLCSEAMHALGVPTTRALSLVATGDTVVRDMFYDGHPKAEPGAIVCRVAPSFLRFGNFEILAAQGEHALLEKLARSLIVDQYTELDPRDPDAIGNLLDGICRRTAVMIAQWMRVGFVHGVMNTDNMSALGLTIDYGPYGWLEPYDPDWTPNTTDAQGRRYRYGHQPTVALWNLARLGESFFPLLGNEERIHRSLTIYRDTFEKTHSRMLAQKLGLASLDSLENQALVQDLFQLLHASETDLTIFFRNLCDLRVDSDQTRPGDDTVFLSLLSPALYGTETLEGSLRERWVAWSGRYAATLRQEGSKDEVRSRIMKQVNPKYVLRNYLAQNAINAAERGDLSIMERLMRVLQSPYDDLAGDDDLAAKRPEWARSAPGCSALSCSS